MYLKTTPIHHSVLFYVLFFFSTKVQCVHLPEQRLCVSWSDGLTWLATHVGPSHSSWTISSSLFPALAQGPQSDRVFLARRHRRDCCRHAQQGLWDAGFVATECFDSQLRCLAVGNIGSMLAGSGLLHRIMAVVLQSWDVQSPERPDEIVTRRFFSGQPGVELAEEVGGLVLWAVCRDIEVGWNMSLSWQGR